LDYTETYSGVVDCVVIRIFLAVVAVLNLHTALFDVSQAFLYGDLEEGEDIYMRLPKYYGSHLVKLLKALYGLKQAGRTFNRKLSRFLMKIGFQQSIVEPCLFYLFTKVPVEEVSANWEGFGVIYVICHVDDMPCASNSLPLMDWFDQQIKLEFDVSSRPLEFFLSLTIEISDHTVSFHQKHYVEELLLKFHDYLETFCSKQNGEIIGKNTSGIPGSVLSKQDLPQTEEEEAAVANLPYPELVGGLLVGWCILFPSQTQTIVD